SYKKIHTRHLKVPGTDEVELTCQAEGYPLAEVSWPNISIPAITSHTKISEGLYQVTSVLRLKPHPGRNFTCPMEDPKIPPSSLLHVFILSFIIAFMFIATMVALRKRLLQKLYPREDATKRSATMVRKEVDR
ncbi:PDCD1LG2, partial [Cervus elaphus hippelaphus]